VLKYWKETKGLALCLSKSGNPIKMYTDSNWCDDKTDGKSITGYCAQMSNSTVVWQARKQRRVASSTTHAEYVALYECVTEVMWIRSFLNELGQNCFIPENCSVMCDNQGAIQIANTTAINNRSKHFVVDYYFVRENILFVRENINLMKEKLFNLEYISSKENLADNLTKPLPGPQTTVIRKAMGLHG
jgi:hypothetical protein